MNAHSFTDTQKLREIYQYLVESCEIELGDKDPNNLKLRFSRWYNFKGKSISGQSKYASVLLGKGVCLGFSAAFKDIASKCGITTEIVKGEHLGERTCLDFIFE